jgi:hypothetical protein
MWWNHGNPRRSHRPYSHVSVRWSHTQRWLQAVLLLGRGSVVPDLAEGACSVAPRVRNPPRTQTAPNRAQAMSAMACARNSGDPGSLRGSSVADALIGDLDDVLKGSIMHPSVSIIAPGNMGAAVGRCLVEGCAGSLPASPAAVRPRPPGRPQREWAHAGGGAGRGRLSIVQPSMALALAPRLSLILAGAVRKPVDVDYNAVSL